MRNPKWAHVSHGGVFGVYYGPYWGVPYVAMVSGKGSLDGSTGASLG